VKLAAAVALAAAALAASPALATPPHLPLCRVSVALDPERAFVGQEVVYRLRIQRRRDVRELTWRENLSFPAFRAEWLPGRTSADPVSENGESFVIYDERRAIFPVRAGRLEVPAAGLLCESEDETQAVRVPAIGLEVDELPASGRPEDYTGLVGPVAISMTVTPERVRLGESVRVSILVQGEANLWEAPTPFGEGDLEPAAVEIFQRPRELARDVGRRLALRRYFTFDLVPRRTGALEIPTVRMPYFDPASGRYRVALAAGRQIDVEERASVVAPVLPGTAPDPGAPPGTATPPGRWAWLLVGAVGLVFGLALLRRRRARPADVWPEVREQLAAALAAEQQSDVSGAAAALARALRAALSDALPEALVLSTEEIFERTTGGEPRELALLLQRLDRARFTAGACPEDPTDGDTALVEIRSVRTALAGLRDA